MRQQGHDSRAIANIFVDYAREKGDRLTIMSLVKYIYFAHGWTLGYTGEPLISHDVQAWRFGPVVSEAYYAFRPHGYIIRKKAVDPDTKKDYCAEGLPERKKNIIDGVYEEYSKMTPWDMSAATHHNSSPWYKYRGRDQRFSVIPNKEIAEYYRGLIAKMQSQ